MVGARTVFEAYKTLRSAHDEIMLLALERPELKDAGDISYQAMISAMTILGLKKELDEMFADIEKENGAR